MFVMEDLKDMNHADVIAHVEDSFETKLPADIEVVAAYESVGNWGCDSSAWYLFRSDGRLQEVHGSHCSCFGFEGQWTPEDTTVEYLLSEKFTFFCGGYCNGVNNAAHDYGGCAKVMKAHLAGWATQ